MLNYKDWFKSPEMRELNDRKISWEALSSATEIDSRNVLLLSGGFTLRPYQYPGDSWESPKVRLHQSQSTSV